MAAHAYKSVEIEKRCECPRAQAKNCVKLKKFDSFFSSLVATIAIYSIDALNSYRQTFRQRWMMNSNAGHRFYLKQPAAVAAMEIENKTRTLQRGMWNGIC